jgi:ArsR family transcriptional regulator
MKTPLDHQVQLHKAIAHPVRLRILAMLRGGELCVCQVIAVTKLAPSTISAHLAELKRAGLVEERKQGKWVHVRLADEEGAGAVLAGLFPSLEGDPRVAADQRLLVKLRAVAVEVLTRAGLDLERIGISECCPAVADEGPPA